MSPRAEERHGITTAADRAAAAAWIARLHGENRTPQVEAGLRRWLAVSPAHRRAFEMASDLWTEAERWPKRTVPEFVGWRRSSAASWTVRALAASFVGLLVAGGVFYWTSRGISTNVGEQRTLILEDGTRVALNTSTNIRVRYRQDIRRIELEQGEALFEVAKATGRPFVVVVGGRQVTALGTAFLVRREDERVAVTLLQGKVTVSAAAESRASAPVAPADQGSASGETQALDGGKAAQHPESATIPVAGALYTLSPGQRLSFVTSRPPELDRPVLDKLTAWQRGEVILDHTPLADAVAELNRYSQVQLAVEDPQARQVSVTGIFRAGDSESFALAVAETYRLGTRKEGGKIVLTGLPRKRAGAAAH